MKLLFFGLGSIGQRHIQNIRKLFSDSFDIMCYRSRKDPHTIIDNKKTISMDPVDYYGLREVDSIEMGFSEKPDAVFITNPTFLHGDYALLAAQHKCHFFVEKPLAHDLKSIPLLLEIVKKNNLIGMVGYQMRFHPAFKLLCATLSTQKLGNIMQGSFCFGEYLPNAHPYEDYRRTYTAKRDQGGGVILSYCHEIDMMYSLFGMPNTVLAYGGKRSELSLDVNDHVSIIVYYEDLKLPIQIQLDYVSTPSRRYCTIVGSKGCFHWDMISNLVTLEFNTGEKSCRHDFSDLSRNQLFEDEITSFFHCIKAGSITRSTVLDGANNFVILNAIQQSVSLSKMVSINTSFS